MIQRKSRWGPRWKWWVVCLHNDDGDAPFGFKPFWAASERGVIRQVGQESGAIELDTIYRRLFAIKVGRWLDEAKAKYKELDDSYHRQQQAYWASSEEPPPAKKPAQVEEAAPKAAICPVGKTPDDIAHIGAKCGNCEQTELEPYYGV